MGIRPVADFETLNYQIMTDINTSTEAGITQNRCYMLWRFGTDATWMDATWMDATWMDETRLESFYY